MNGSTFSAGSAFESRRIAGHTVSHCGDARWAESRRTFDRRRADVMCVLGQAVPFQHLARFVDAR